MFPHERSLVEQMKGKPFALLGVSTDESRQNVKHVQKNGDVTWRNWWNGDSPRNRRLTDVWGVIGIPNLFLIDHKGIIREHFEGSPGDARLDQAIDRLVKEAEKGE
jgi:hypothetical protein